jgi:D-amino-acid dehydrogenase
MRKNIIIVGGGIIGLSSAYFLQKEGHKVTILEKETLTHGASFVNAGYLTPSHIVPLAAPGMIKQGLKWMFNSSSPFYIKPRIDFDFFSWAWAFHRSSTVDKVKKAMPLIYEINMLSKTLYQEIKASEKLDDFQLDTNGLLLMYKTEKARDHEIQVTEQAKKIGLQVHHLNRDELHNLQPELKPEVRGAFHYLDDAHTTPPQFMVSLKEYLMNVGVEIKTQTTVTGFTTHGQHIVSVDTYDKSYPCDEMVLAAGSWSQKLGEKLGLSLKVQAGKGYRINVDRPTPVTLPAVLMEAKCAVTPMNGFTRFAGTMEFSGTNQIIRKERVKAIAKAAMGYYDNLEITTQEIESAECGLRPVTPDGLPYIGRISNFNNVVVGTGHAMMGWSLGPATGKLISEIIDHKKASMNLEAFHPERKF